MSGWVFTNRFGNVLSAKSTNKAIERMVKGYNAYEEEKAKEENREPVLIQHITNHSLRHSFCTRLIEKKVNLKVVQDIMGHADFETTMDIYTAVSKKWKEQEIGLLDAQFSLLGNSKND
jgi:integrase